MKIHRTKKSIVVAGESSDICSCTDELRIAAAITSLYISLRRSTADSTSGSTLTGSIDFLKRGVGTTAVVAAVAFAASAIAKTISLQFIGGIRRLVD
ncbi:unnamed protein product [Prunus armeniaca]|uniref:Uncharacterized protein n=1 Tax=Prunus armeniaca TaxID=36596 RepID=A0A6J5W7M2_PRUAR|nr:unnamed protein product [Prunus armeniaca]